MTDTANIPLPKTGIYHGIPEQVYREWPCLSQTLIKYGTRSMLHMKHAVDGGEKPPTDDMQLGRALHTAFLEPGLMPERVALWEGGKTKEGKPTTARRGPDWEAFKAANSNKVILTKKRHAQLLGMTRRLRTNPRLSEHMRRLVGVEVSAIGTICGLPIKGRCDVLLTGGIDDLKKARDISERGFTNAIFNLGYHMQAFIYKKLFGGDEFGLFAIEDKEPFDVAYYELPAEVIREGEKDVVAVLDQWKFANERGVWPGRYEHAIQVQVPEWKSPGIEIDFGDDEKEDE